ncbi:MAG: hypothetical protein RIR00_633 [Pseudomonadota bacterium]
MIHFSCRGLSRGRSHCLSHCLSHFPARLLALGATLLGLAACSSAPPQLADLPRGDFRPVQRYLETHIPQLMQKHDVAGLSIAVVDDQRVLWATGFGQADAATGRPAAAETVYRVGSISKVFTATAALQLVEQGKLSLDQPLEQLLPGFSLRYPDPAAGLPTLRQVLYHHAGLPRDRLQGFMTPQPRPYAELVTDSGTDQLIAPPGRMFSYSNIGFSLAGRALERASGEDFSTLLQRQLLTPLGMRSAEFAPGASATPDMARPHAGLAPASELPLRDVPAGGLNASVLDLGRYLSMLFADGRSGDKVVLSPASIAEMQHPQNGPEASSRDEQFGLAWFIGALRQPRLAPAGRLLQHGGATVHFHSQIMALPEARLGVVVLANSSTARGVVDHLAYTALSLAWQSKTGRPLAEKPPLPPLADTEPGAAQRAALVGDYMTPLGLAQLREHNGSLRAKLGDDELPLRLHQDGKLRLHYALLGLFPVDLGFIGDIGLQPQTVLGHAVLTGDLYGREVLVGGRLPDPVDLAPWRAHLGRYRVTNAGDDQSFFDQVELLEQDGRLIVALNLTLEGNRRALLPLLPEGPNRARLPGLLPAYGESLRLDADGSVHVSGYRLEKVQP